jgi:hypothetical protein
MQEGDIEIAVTGWEAFRRGSALIYPMEMDLFQLLGADLLIRALQARR